MTEFSFYQQHLDRVSRSFSFCIRELKQPYKLWVGLTYLLCRMADTIEDISWPSRAHQLEAFSGFSGFLKALPGPKEYQAWLTALPPVPPHEQALLEDGLIVLQDFHALPKEVQTQVFSNIQIMLKGMVFFLQKQPKPGEFHLYSTDETTLYCYFVAGIIGILLTHLYAGACKDDPRTLNRATHFGLFLQKINILKDQLTDEAQGRFFIYCRNSVLSETAIHARNAMDYIKDIHIEHDREYRLFCAWSLFIGLASLPWIQKSFREQKKTTIPQKTTLDLIFNIREIVDDNVALERLFQRYFPKAVLPIENMDIKTAEPCDKEIQDIICNTVV